MLTKQEFLENPVRMVRSEGIKGKILMMYPSDPEDGNSYPLMYAREKEIIKKRVKEVCERYKPKKVLEIGYGLGYTAQQFQDCGIKSHTIVEAHPDIYKNAVKWSKLHDNVKVIHSFIQNLNINEKDYDIIFDDRFEIVHDLKGVTTPRYKVKGNEWEQLYSKEDRFELTK